MSSRLSILRHLIPSNIGIRVKVCQRISPFPMSVLTCKLPLALDGRLAELARRRGVPKSVLVREAIEAKIAGEAAASAGYPTNLIEALGGSVGSIASGKRDLARNKKHLQDYGR